MNPSVDGIILAGGFNRIPLFPGCLPGSKALVPIGGRPLIQYSLTALEQVEGLGQRIVVGPRDVACLAAAEGFRAVEVEDDSLLASLRAGLEAATATDVLFLTGDLPLLRAEMLEEFIRLAREVDADVCASVVDHQSMGRYVDWKKPFVPFADGRFAHGNLFMLPREVLHHRSFWRPLNRLYASRKRAYKTLSKIGPGLLLWFFIHIFLFRDRTLREGVQRVSQTLGVSLDTVTCPHPEVCLDIDEPEDYTMAARYLRGA